MKKYISIVYAGLILLTGFLHVHSLWAQKYFDTSPVYSDSIRLTILNPSAKRITTIQYLRERGLIALEKLLIIGLYHEDERTNYAKVGQYIEDNEINWVKFHSLSGDLSENIIFKNNRHTKDFQNVFIKSDGIMLFGGADIPPYLYNHQTNLSTLMFDPKRHYLELSLAFHLLGGSQNTDVIPLLETNPGFPIIGFCLGAQTINVATGGTMIQDIWSELYKAESVEDVLDLGPDNWHKNPYVKLYPEKDLVYYSLHKIHLLKQGKLISEFNFNEYDTPLVLSGHHQMIDSLGKGIRIIATSLDKKVPEAIEHVKYPHVLGVQFHPEYEMLWNPDNSVYFAPSDTAGKNLYTILKQNPPSLDFHKKIWSWFEEQLIEYHRGRIVNTEDRK